MPVATLRSCYAFDTTRFFPGDTVTLLGCLECDLRMFTDCLPGDSNFYDSLQSRPLYYEEDKPEFDHALTTLASLQPAAVLDVGAGCGHFLKKLKRLHGIHIRASELSTRSLNALLALGIEIDATSDRYDFISSFQVFEHVADLRALVTFVDMKLLPGGHLLVSVPNPESPLFRETFAYLDYPPHHMHRLTRRSLEYIGRMLGYATVDYWQESMRIEHYAAVAQGRRQRLLAGRRCRWLLEKLGTLSDLCLLPAQHGYHREIGHSHTMVYRKPI